MIETLLIIVGFVYAVRCRKLGRLTSQDFPGVDAAKFFEWQEAVLLVNDIYLCATWGTAFIKIVLSFVLWQMGQTDDELLAASFAGLVVWLGGLTAAVIYGSKARRLWTALIASRNEIRSRRISRIASEVLITPHRRTTRLPPRQPSTRRISPSATPLPAQPKRATSTPGNAAVVAGSSGAASVGMPPGALDAVRPPDDDR